MTTNQAAYAALLAMDGPPPRRIDRIRAHISASKTLSAVSAVRTAGSFGLHRPNENSGTATLNPLSDSGPRSLHPGDILYWVACLGGACLLLVCATR